MAARAPGAAPAGVRPASDARRGPADVRPPNVRPPGVPIDPAQRPSRPRPPRAPGAARQTAAPGVPAGPAGPAGRDIGTVLQTGRVDTRHIRHDSARAERPAGPAVPFPAHERAAGAGCIQAGYHVAVAIDHASLAVGEQPARGAVCSVEIEAAVERPGGNGREARIGKVGPAGVVAAIEDAPLELAAVEDRADARLGVGIEARQLVREPLVVDAKRLAELFSGAPSS